MLKPLQWLVPTIAVLSACTSTPARRVALAPSFGPQHVGVHLQIRADSGRPPSGDQMVAGWMGSVAGGFLAWRAFDEPNGQHSHVKDDWGYTPRALTALAIGSHVGSTLGVWWRGHANGSRGSALVTAAAAAPATIGILAMNDDPLLMLKLVIALGPVQSAMAYTGYRVSTQSRAVPRPDELIAQRELPRPRRSANVITRDELLRSTYSNAYDAIRLMRPQWAAAARQRSPAEREAAGEGGVIVVYLDGTRLGSTEELVQIRLSEVEDIQYFDALEATNRFGTGHPAGAIVVRRALNAR